jgi:hypothetical protein
MTSINCKTEADFGAFIPSMLDDFGLNPFEFRVYAHISRRAGGGGKCWEGMQNIADLCKMNIKTTRKAIAALVAFCLIRVEFNPGATNHITLTHPSEWEKPDTPTKSGMTTKTDTPTKSGRTPLPNQGVPPLPDLVDEGTPYEGTPKKDLFPLPQKTKNDRALEKEERSLEKKNAKEESETNFGVNDRFWDVSKAPWKNDDGTFREEMIAAFAEINKKWDICTLPNGKRNDIAIANHLRRKEARCFAQTITNEERIELLAYWQYIQENAEPETAEKSEAESKQKRWDELRSQLQPLVDRGDIDVYIHTDGAHRELRARCLKSGHITIESRLHWIIQSYQYELLNEPPF